MDSQNYLLPDLKSRSPLLNYLEEQLILISDMLVSNKADLSQYTKIGTQYKTKADNFCNTKLTDLLCSICSCPILSEESYEEEFLFDADMYWILDPLDGSGSYCKGYSGYVIQASLIFMNKPYFSFIYAPEFKLFAHVCGDEPSHINGNLIHLNSDVLRQDLILIDNYPEPRGYALSVFETLRLSNYVECGSFGLKLIRILLGDAHLFVKDVSFFVWDVIPAIHLFDSSPSKCILSSLNLQVPLSLQFKYNQGLLALSSSTFKGFLPSSLLKS